MIVTQYIEFSLGKKTLKYSYQTENVYIPKGFLEENSRDKT